MKTVDEILQETSLSQLSSAIINTGTIRVDRPTIFMTIPDPSTPFELSLNTLGIQMSNCDGIISPGNIISVGTKKINGKSRVLDLKKTMLSLKHGRKFKILSVIPTLDQDSKKSNNFYLYDMTIFVQLYKKLLDVYSEKIASEQLLSAINFEYEKLKRINPSISNDLLFVVNNEDGGIFQFLHNFKRYFPPDELEKYNIFDNVALISNSNGKVLTIMNKIKLKNNFLTVNANKISDLFDTETTPIIDKDGSSKTEDITVPTTPEPFLPSLTAILKEKAFRSESKTNILDTSSVDSKELSTIMRKYEIKDPDTIANIKAALDKYVSEKKEKLSKDEAELVVLKAINYTIHGKDEIDEEYLAKPEKLFRKLIQQTTYKVPLVFPKNMGEGIHNLDEIIDIKNTTGAWRQKHEFENTIHKNVEKLFSSLEDVGTRPIKVKSIEHVIEDNNSDRLLKYKITLQNVTGGSKKPYVVELNVPSPVNDRYFKLGNNFYVMPVQQFLKPVTKTSKDVVRIISNYSTINVGIKNLKFNPADTDDILEYINIRYPKLIKSLTDDLCEFTDGSIIYLSGNNVYKSKKLSVHLNDEYKLVDQDDKEILQQHKSEFLYTLILNKIAEINPEDKLTKTKKTIPFVYVYLGGITIPLIIYLWQFKGLMSALNDLGITYHLTKEVDPADIYVEGTDGEFLVLTPKTDREKFIANGIIAARFKAKVKNFDDPAEIHPIISQTYGSGSVYQMRLQTQNCIDPVTKEILAFENLPLNLPNLISTDCLDLLLNKKQTSLADLRNYRARISEVLLNIMYKQIKMAHNRYVSKVDEFGDEEAQIMLDPDYIIKDLITEAGVLQHAETVSPIDEIFLASKTIKTGPGGVPSRRAFKPEHRNIHPTQYGNMAAVTTPEADGVGLLVSHTLTPVITNELGSYGQKDLAAIETSKFGALSINEALTPFQNEVDSDRLLLAATHAKQDTPTNGNEAPLVRTGAEAIVPQISSTRFIFRAKSPGKVINIVPNSTITVQYSNNKKEAFDITPRLSKTKMGQFISLELNHLNVGESFEKGQMIAGTKSFNQNGLYCSGKNMFIAIMNYNGFSHEDAYVITKDVADTMTRDLVKEIQIIIPPDAKVLNFNTNIGTKVNSQDVLVEFAFEKDLESYLQLNDLANDENVNEEEYENLFKKSQNTIKLMALEGEIFDIKIFLNSKKNTDPKIVKFHSQLIKNTKDKISTLSSNSDTELEKIHSVDNMNLKFMKIGGHKLKGRLDFLGAKVVFYIKHVLPLEVGDKLSGRFGEVKRHCLV